MTASESLPKQELEALKKLKDIPLAILNAEAEYVKQIGDPRRLSDNNNVKVSDQIKELLQQDPRLMPEELKAAHEVFQTHKLAYLEHETKVEFLKIMMNAFEDDDESSTYYANLFLSLNEDTIAQEERANAELKSKLKSEKRRVESLQSWVEQAAKQLVDDVADVVQTKPAEILKMTTEIDEMQREIDALEEKEKAYYKSLTDQLGIDREDGQEYDINEDPVAKMIKETEEFETRVHELEHHQLNQQTNVIHGPKPPKSTDLESLTRELDIKSASNSALEREIAQLTARDQKLRDITAHFKEPLENSLPQDPQAFVLLQQLSRNNSISDINEYVESGETNTYVVQQAIDWYSNVNTMMSKMLGIDYSTLRLLQKGPHHILYKFTKQVSIFGKTGNPKLFVAAQISYELFIVNLTGKIETGKITGIHLLRRLSVKSGDNSSGEPVADNVIDRAVLAQDVLTQTKALYGCSPSFFVNETSRIIRERLNSLN
ncbi:uncharacterized protein SAPINGB_P005027 [Magnusiomyces paraingens]|uniref:Kinetochore protein Sos7 coiled-coil domain-containing protein n=1 Tax=Magnusiomyces paraingens TaxID=2606893 RepID=A0A5E8BY43_9ASCO|nr:uncharacterized protein SAPINGB_P005027 [Saprochaete ingens]VVT56383.1 unnamed protein product [Saprochaete ingens]